MNDSPTTTDCATCGGPLSRFNWDRALLSDGAECLTCDPLDVPNRYVIRDAEPAVLTFTTVRKLVVWDALLDRQAGIPTTGFPDTKHLNIGAQVARMVAVGDIRPFDVIWRQAERAYFVGRAEAVERLEEGAPA